MIKEVLKRIAGIYYTKKYFKQTKNNCKLNGYYGSLRFVAEYSNDSFVRLKKYNDLFNLKSISNKPKIKLGFVVYTSSMWNVDELYSLISKDDRFECSIIVAHVKMSDTDSSNKEYLRTMQFFEKLKYNTIEACSIDNIRQYDILYYLSPTIFSDKIVDFYNVPFSTIILHSSYSYMLAGNMEKLNIWLYHWAIKYYTDSEYYKKLIEKSKNYTGNAAYLGFPKMDKFYSSEMYRPSNKKVIIYAPHHSVHYKKFKSATFEDNYQEILKIAKKYADSTYWIYKPHPLLRANSVIGGIFKSVEEYDAYEEEWSNLFNAEVVTSGDYYPVFKGSDAMITDSVSFLAEYQFTEKPLLLLESGEETYNDFGNEIVNILYKCDGKAISDIEKFVTDVVNGNDTMLEKRKIFFENNLFYMKEGVTANKRIYDDIMSMISREN